MNITNRQRDILDYLLQQAKEVTAGDIAGEIHVSTRTVHRELSAVEQWLIPYGIKLEKKSGIGIYIDADPSRLIFLREQLYSSESEECSAEDRKIFILCMLLDDREPIKLLALAAELKVTIATISHDLDELQAWIEQRGLVLVRRRGYGVQITGHETDKRRAISELALEHLNESDLFGQDELRPVTRVTGKLLELIGRQNLLTVEEALWQPNEKWLENMVEAKYMELLIQLCTAIARLRLGYIIQVKDERSQSRFAEEDSMRTAMVARICTELTATLSLDFPESERTYFSELFLAAEDRTTRLLPLDDIVLLETVNELIDLVEDHTHTHFSEDRLLREGLIAHVEPALKRLKEGKTIRNPLLQQIRKDYEELYIAVKDATTSMTELGVPDEEIGFLVMHFGASVERLRQLRRDVRAIVVCTSGIGSSRLLATRLARELPQIKIADRVSWYEAARIPKEDYDLVISTVDLPLEADRYLKISPLLTQEESERLRHFIQTITLNKVNDKPERVTESNQGMEWLRGVQTSLQEIVHIIQEFKVLPLDNRGLDVRETVLAMSMSELRRGSVSNPESVTDLLMEREKHGSQVIPDTPIALFHTRSPHIHKPSLTLYALMEPMQLEEMADGIQHVLLMLGPRELSKESLEVLSEISAMLLQEEMITLLELGNREDIVQFISNQLADFFRSKIETGRNIL